MARAQGGNEGGGVAAGASGRRVERPGQLAGEEPAAAVTRTDGDGGAPVFQ